MNPDLNKNGLIDMLEQQIQHASTSTISSFATVAKKASEIRDGANKCYFDKVNKCLVIKHGNKQMTDCLQLGAKRNTINNVESIHFKDESTLKGLCDELTEMTTEEAKQYVPTMNLIKMTIDPHIETIYEGLTSVMNKTHDLSYNEEEEETTIEHDLVVGGEIACDWLNNEFAKYALVGHNHDLTYAPLVHNHEFADIYKQTTRTIINENTNEEEEITETLTLNDILDSKADVGHIHAIADVSNLQTTLDGKASTSHNHDSTYAALNHTHEFADIYKQTTRMIINETTNEEEEITDTKTLQEVLNEYEQSLTNAINQGLNGKANASHTHEFADIYKTIQIEENGQTTTTTKTLQQILNEYEQSMMNAINGKANTSHTHNATDIIYKSNVNVKQELDNINQQLDIKDENGNKIDILAAIFGTTTGVGALIDGGLIAAVGTLQEEVALLQTQIATLATSDLTNDVLDVVNSAGEVVEGGASVWKGLKGIANAWKQMRTAAAGYVNLSNAEAIPLMPL